MSYALLVFGFSDLQAMILLVNFFKALRNFFLIFSDNLFKKFPEHIFFDSKKSKIL